MLESILKTRFSIATMLNCRLCRNPSSAYTCKRLFTTAGIHDCWTDLIIELLEVPVTRGDGLPAQICSSCSTKVRTIEDSLECLLEMRQSAKELDMDDRLVSDVTLLTKVY